MKSGGNIKVNFLVMGMVLIFSGSVLGAAYFQGLGDLLGGPYKSKANGVSGDGKVVVGYGTPDYGPQDAFIWTSEPLAKKI